MKRQYQQKVLTTLMSAFVACIVLLSATTAQAYHFPWDQGHDTTDWTDPNDPGPCEGPLCDPCSATRSPVYIPTGHFVWSDTDITLKGRPQIALVRTYNSHDPRDGLFGNGWSVGCDVGLYAVNDNGNTNYILRAPDGKRYEYVTQTDGSITSPPGRFEQVVPQNDGSVNLVYLNGSQKVFGSDGKLIADIDSNGNRIDYSYGANGLLNRIADVNGRFLDIAYNSSGRVSTVTDHSNRSWEYNYDTAGNLVSRTDPLGGTKSYTYSSYTPSGDANTYHHLTRVTDETGVTITQVVYNGERVTSYTEGENRFTYSYNTSTRTVTKTDRVGSRWTFVYNADGLITRDTDPLGNVINRTFDANGREVSVADKAGQTWAATYDEIGRTLTRTNPLGNTISFQYAGNSPSPERITSPSGRVMRFTYDENFNLTSITDPANEVTRFQWNTNGDKTATINALNENTSVSYNAIGLPVAITDALGRTISIGYDNRGNSISIANAEGETIQYEYDALDRLVRETDALNQVTQYTYDAASRQISVTAPNNEQVSYVYDAFGRKIQRINYDGTMYSFTYRIDNLLEQTTQPSGTVTVRSYNLGKRLTQINVGGEVTSLQYSARGLLLQASNDSGTVNRAYDDVGRLVSETVNGQTIQYNYNNEDELTQLIGLGKTQSYVYDNRGLLTQISGATGQYDFNYDALGRRNQLVQPNNNVASYQYDAGGQLTQIQHSGIFNANYQYQFDNASRMVNWTGDGAPKTYQYDVVSQLTQSDDDFGTNNYQYDELGNILGNGKTYDNANRLVQDTNTTYSYDANGNLTQKQDIATGARTVYTWNTRNQLVRLDTYVDGTAATPASTISYTYGPLGRRWSKTVDGVTSKYIYSGHNRIGTLDNLNNLLEYITFSAKVDEPIGMEKGGSNYYFHSNHQGSVMALTDGASVPVSYQYDAYGRAVVSGDDGINDFRYTGREFDGNNLYYYRARYYDVESQRFISSDPIGLRAGLNTYAYVGGNPLNLIDPFGLEEWYFNQLKDAYQGKNEMLQGKNFHQTALDAIEEGGSCATRLSNAFNRAGYDALNDAFKNTNFTTVGDGLGNRYIMGAGNLASHLGVSTSANKISNMSEISGKKGIIYFDNYHIDLYDGTEMVGNGEVSADYTDKAMYFKELPTDCQCE